MQEILITTFNRSQRTMTSAVADLGGRRGRPPPGTQIPSISCSFWDNLAKSHVGTPLGSWRPPRGNPGSAAALGTFRIRLIETVFFCQWIFQSQPNFNLAKSLESCYFMEFLKVQR